jgi:hypothetical protein
LHVVDIPRLRLLGFAIMAGLVVLRQAVVPSADEAPAAVIAALVITYSVVLWFTLSSLF